MCGTDRVFTEYADRDTGAVGSEMSQNSTSPPSCSSVVTASWSFALGQALCANLAALGCSDRVWNGQTVTSSVR